MVYENDKTFFIHHFFIEKNVLRAIPESLVCQDSCKDQSKW